jgi:hypothetical protein
MGTAHILLGQCSLVSTAAGLALLAFRPIEPYPDEVALGLLPGDCAPIQSTHARSAPAATPAIWRTPLVHNRLKKRSWALDLTKSPPQPLWGTGYLPDPHPGGVMNGADERRRDAVSGNLGH